MGKYERKNIYISNVVVDGTVFQTQVLDWLHLFKTHQLNFELIQAFPIRDLKRPSYIKNQLVIIKKSTELFVGCVYFLPSRNILYLVNTLIIFLKIFRHIFFYQRILIFSRALIGKEIILLRKIFPSRIVFYYDARGAAFEENKYSAEKIHDYSSKKQKMINDTYCLEHRTLCAANKIFTVSIALQKYFQKTYNLKDKKFVLYPCLSDSSKFYFSLDLRSEVRRKLHIESQTKVFIYSGGTGLWHMSEKLIMFFAEVLKHFDDSLLLYLTKDKTIIDKSIANLPELKSKVLCLSVSNEEVSKYLNAADYGLLFRENTIMNNVAAPTKFAEYILCGLPVIISEGIGDYSELTAKYNLGVIIKDNILQNPEKFEFNNFQENNFDRSLISDFGVNNLSKNSIISTIINELKS